MLTNTISFKILGDYSPRAQGFLFTFSRPKGLKVVSSVEISADFENPFLKKICVERFSEIELKIGYPHFELWPFCKSENLPPILFRPYLSQ